MGIKVEYLNNGVYYYLSYKKNMINFPLQMEERAYKKLFKSEEWGKLQLLEQLWYQDIIQLEGDGVYVLPTQSTYTMDIEDRIQLDLPSQGIGMKLEEDGNIGSSNYKIYTTFLVGGIHVGRTIRKGCYLLVGQKNYWLTKDQFRLCETIEQVKGSSNVLDRGRNLTKIKKIAQDAHIQMSNFTQSREFYLADEIGVQCSCVDDHLIELVPEIEDIPENVVAQIDNNFDQVNQLYIEGKKINVLFNDTSQNVFKTIKEHKKIEGANVPKFLDNPLAFIPDECTFNLEEFAKRVKGFKVYRSIAMPFVHLNPSANQVGWFDVELGIEIKSEESETSCIEDSEHLQQLVDQAIEEGEEYVYDQNRWIKIDPLQYQAFKEKKAMLDANFPAQKVPESHLHTVLDIFENLEGVEYNETFLEERVRLLHNLVPVRVSRLFNGTLKKHQIEGYQFLCMQYDSKWGTLLADDMGLGKTVQIISLMAYLEEHQQLAPALIVMPASLIENWQEEIETFCPSIDKDHIYVHLGSTRHKYIEALEHYKVILTTYETLARDQILLGKIKWGIVICDETQKIKNFKTLAAHAIKAMNTEHRIAMTGTPVENRLSELWSIVDFVQPGLLKNYAHFKKQYEKPIQENVEANQILAQELIDTIKPIFLRRTKKDVLSQELPNKFIHKEQVALSNIQKQLYYKLISQLKHEQKGTTALATIQKLIMLCSHPRLIENDIEAPTKVLVQESPKLQYTMELLSHIKKAGEKVIIFTTYKKMQMILRRVIFDSFKIDAKIINGEVARGRVEEINRFNQVKGFNVIILSPKAAGVGLNITGANHVIHYTREWNPAVEAQATDRVYRIGQTKPVHVYYPICTSVGMTTVEEKLDLLLEGKMKLMDNVIVPAGLEVSLEELKEGLYIEEN